MQLDITFSQDAFTSATPARRRESTITAARFASQQDQEWTAARCHRLLRALTSRVAILSREVARYSIVLPPLAKTDTSLHRHAKTECESPNWIRSKKKIRQTYGSKGRAVKGNSLRIHEKASSRVLSAMSTPGEILIPTPMLIRATECEMEPCTNSATLSGQIKCQLGKRRTSRREYTADDNPGLPTSQILPVLRKTTTTSRFTTYEGIYHGLEMLLKSTSKPTDGTPRRGSKSLLSMALKNVPKYIYEQEQLLFAHNGETGGRSICSRDIATEIYDELEGLGTSGKSWRGLGTVVRSHGLQVISNAIREGLLELDICGALTNLCASFNAFEEAESIFTALLCSHPFSEPRTVYEVVDRRFTMLWNYTISTNRIAFQYRQLSHMIVRGILPASWLATKGFASFWTTIIQSTTPISFDPDAMEFLSKCLPLLARTRDHPSSSDATTQSPLSEAMRNTFGSILTTFVSIYMLNREKHNRCELNVERHSEYQSIVIFLRRCLAESRCSKTLSASGYALLILANLAIDSDIDKDERSRTEYVGILFEVLWRHGDHFLDNTSNCNEMITFITNVARCCGRGASGTGLEYMQILHVRLEELTAQHDAKDIMRGIIVDSAYLFSQKVPNKLHLEYAARLDARLGNSDRGIHNRQDLVENEPGLGFRWEEGIGEWVTRTPIINDANRKLARQAFKTRNREVDWNVYSSSPTQAQQHNEKRISRNSSSHSARHFGKLSALLASYCDDDPLINSSFGSMSSDDDVSSDESSLADSTSQNVSSDADDIFPPQKRARTTCRASGFFCKPQVKGADFERMPSISCKITDKASRCQDVQEASNETCQVVNESDDELSFNSSDFEAVQVTQEIFPTAMWGDCDTRRRFPVKRRKVVGVLHDGSEDELCC